MGRQTSIASTGDERGSMLLCVSMLALAAGCNGATASTAPPSASAAPVTALAEAAMPSATVSVAPASAPSASAAPQVPEGARIYSRTRFTWIHSAPGETGWIGYLSMGGSAPLKGGSAATARAAPGAGGCDAWYAIEPRGFVCAGSSATLDANDLVVQALQKDGPDLTSPWPYHYGEATTFAPRYKKPPSASEQRSTEEALDKHLERAAAARALGPDAGSDDKVLGGVDLAPAGVPFPEAIFDVGPTVRQNRRSVFPGSTVAYTRAFDGDGGRTFLSTWDHAFVPKDKVRPFPRREFHGVELNDQVALPLAFFRKSARPQYRKAADGSLTATGETWPRLAWVALTGDEVLDGGKRYLATRDRGIFVRADDATVVERSKTQPFFGPKGEARRSWLDISVLGGWLVAYEDATPVFATLISPGRGGIPYPGIDPLKTASTPVGTFRVDGKFKTATMVSSTDDNLVHSEVQYVQNFHGPHALHGAYWHDSWGEPKSGGCINLSPLDSQRMFDWTDPKVPPGWHGIRSVKEFGAATTVVVHR